MRFDHRAEGVVDDEVRFLNHLDGIAFIAIANAAILPPFGPVSETTVPPMAFTTDMAMRQLAAFPDVEMPIKTS